MTTLENKGYALARTFKWFALAVFVIGILMGFSNSKQVYLPQYQELQIFKNFLLFGTWIIYLIGAVVFYLIGEIIGLFSEISKNVSSLNDEYVKHEVLDLIKNRNK